MLGHECFYLSILDPARAHGRSGRTRQSNARARVGPTHGTHWEGEVQLAEEQAGGGCHDGSDEGEGLEAPDKVLSALGGWGCCESGAL